MPLLSIFFRLPTTSAPALAAAASRAFTHLLQVGPRELIHDMALVAFHIVYDHVRPHGQNGRYLDPAHLVLIDDVGREAPKTCPDLMEPG